MSPLQPLRTDDRAAIGVGTAAWAVGLVVTLLFRDWFVSTDRAWWTWVCAAGIGLGALGMLYVHFRERHRTPPAEG